MKYTINCIIELYNRDRKLDKEFKLKIQDKEIIIKPSSENENDLNIVINTDEYIKDEIESILKILAYFIVVIEELPFKDYRIRSKENNETGEKNAFGIAKISAKFGEYFSGSGGKIKIQELLENKELLANININNDFNLIAQIFNDALKDKSIISKYILLYGALEILLGNAGESTGGEKLTGRITSWIKGNISLEGITIPADRNPHRKYEHTIFTNLRDRIHHKFLNNSLFSEIEKYLPYLQNLVKRKIICEYNL
jgi:hypothetical protein